MTYLKGGSETVSQDAQKLADEQNALNNEINDYQNNHNTGGVKQAELPVELEEKIIDSLRKIQQAAQDLTVCFLLLMGRAIFPAKCFEAHFRACARLQPKCKTWRYG